MRRGGTLLKTSAGGGLIFAFFRGDDRVVAAPRPEVYTRRLRDHARSWDVLLALLTADGTVVASSKPTPALWAGAPRPPALQQDLVFGIRADDAHFVGASRRLTLSQHFWGGEWYAVLLKDRATAMAPLRAARGVFYSLLAMVTIGGLLAAMIYIRRLTSRIEILRNATGRLAAGDFDGKVEFHSADEFQVLGEAFNAMTEKLKQGEEARVREAAARRSHEELRHLHERAESVREEERTRIARRIHGDVGQALTALSMSVARLREGDGSETGRSGDAILPILEQIDRLVEMVQDISMELRPSILDHLGLKDAMTWVAQKYAEKTGLRMVLNLDGSPAVDKDRATTIYRIFQELLTNVVRHAGAKKVTVTLQQEAGALVLDVADDGRGIAETDVTSPTSLGLLEIRERARRHGGEVEIAGRPNRGTTVRVSFPPEDRAVTR